MLDLHESVLKIQDTIPSNKILNDNWLILSQIGGGSYGNIYLAENHNTNEKVAIKKFKKTNENDGIDSTTLREMLCLKKLKNHKNLIKILEIFEISNSMFAVMELMKMDLNEYIKQRLQPETAIPLATIKVIIYQIIQGVDYIHWNGFLHRDLKPQNILINDEDDSVKITDFGSCRLGFNDSKNGFSPNVMTPLYRAPEVMLGGRDYTKAVDLWSIGCILGELILKRPLFDYESEVDIALNVFKLFGVKFTAEISLNKENGVLPKEKLKEMLQGFDDEEGLDFFGKLMVLNPKKRITAKEALKHRFFEGVMKK